jgi:hypothetical protein
VVFSSYYSRARAAVGREEVASRRIIGTIVDDDDLEVFAGLP